MSNQKSLSLLSWKWPVLVTIALIFIWLPFEDTTILVPLFLALPISGLVVWVCFHRFQLDYVHCGVVGGLVMAPIAVLLMAFKTGVHGHEVADFTARQILSVIKSAPAWTFAGGLSGWICKRKASTVVAHEPQEHH